MNKPAGAGRIAPVSAALATARRDPRLARHGPPASRPAPPPAPAVVTSASLPHIAPNVFDIKPLERVTKRKNVITIDVRPDTVREARRRDPRLDKRDPRRDKRRDDRPRRPDQQPPADRDERRKEIKDKEKKTDDKADGGNINVYMDKLQILDPKKINRLPPIPKINREVDTEAPAPKRKKEPARDKKKKKEDGTGKERDKDSSSGSSPEKKARAREVKKKLKERVEADIEKSDGEVVAFKELKNYHKEHYMRRNKEKSESPELNSMEVKESSPVLNNDTSSKIPIYVNRMRG